MEFLDNSTHHVDNATHTNESADIQTVPEGFEFRFIYEGILLNCVTVFGLVTNVIAVIVLLRLVNFFLES